MKKLIVCAIVSTSLCAKDPLITFFDDMNTAFKKMTERMYENAHKQVENLHKTLGDLVTPRITVEESDNSLTVKAQDVALEKDKELEVSIKGTDQQTNRVEAQFDSAQLDLFAGPFPL